jgi:hypothetical protein
MRSIAELSRDQYNIVFRLLRQVSIAEYAHARMLGYSVIEAADSAVEAAADLKRIVES